MAGLKFHYFKRTLGDLPRVKRILGFLKSIEMESLLDVGSGRGAFLWPCLDAFPRLPVTCVDLLPHRVELLNAVRRGGVSNLRTVTGDVCTLLMPDKSYDVVTLLEVLEHIPDMLAAVRTAVRIAGKYIAVTVPSKPDSNPEHIRLLTRDALTELFEEALKKEARGARLHFDGVPGQKLHNDT